MGILSSSRPLPIIITSRALAIYKNTPWTYTKFIYCILRHWEIIKLNGNTLIVRKSFARSENLRVKGALYQNPYHKNSGDLKWILTFWAKYTIFILMNLCTFYKNALEKNIGVAVNLLNARTLQSKKWRMYLYFFEVLRQSSRKRFNLVWSLH